MVSHGMAQVSMFNIFNIDTFQIIFQTHFSSNDPLKMRCIQTINHNKFNSIFFLKMDYLKKFYKKSKIFIVAYN